MNIYEYFWGVIADIVVVIVGLMLRGMFCYAAFEDVQNEDFFIPVFIHYRSSEKGFSMLQLHY